MTRECIPCKARQQNGPTFRHPSTGRSAGATAAATGVSHEVLDANGRPTGRKFSSLVAATTFAGRLGGSTRPVK